MDYSQIKEQVEIWYSQLDTPYSVHHLKEYLQCLAEDEADKRIDELDNANKR